MRDKIGSLFGQSHIFLNVPFLYCSFARRNKFKFSHAHSVVAATFLLFKVAVVAWSQIRSRWIEVLTNCSVDCSLEVDLQQLLLLNFGDFFASNITAQLLWGKYASFICQLTTLLCSWKHWMICQSLILGCISSTMIGNNTRNGSTCNGVNSSNGHSPNRNITVSTCQTIIYIYYLLFIIIYCAPHTLAYIALFSCLHSLL